METKQIKTGRRKTSVAQAELVKGSGKVIINTKTLEDYFRGCPRYQDTVLAPLSEIKAEKEFDVNVKVSGGGIASQAGAIRHAIARSLAVLGEDNKKSMKKAGFLTRDPRMVERKKPGQPKARRRFQFSKR
ncbi:30S ribosomal protein S9 [Candidatus Proelusimicrobium excrementi]|uniref:30S ribosomal protein S9 n=1 Tax=Candidatus Proelusimicrobium excrementi TaxID=3416222 RepID=UPI003C909A82|nr:30S ribosomal protein S9 [Elusimicrobiaceae bacterium]